MENLTDPDALVAKERELRERERQLEASEQKYAQRNKDFNPSTRLLMAVAAQGAGYILLHILGVSIFLSGQENIARGLDFINLSATYYIIISFAIPLAVGVHVYIRTKLEQFHVDIILLAYVVVDLVILLRLVCQQGGLCRSMFLPVFFLIPTAYMIVERREPKLHFRIRRMLVLMAIVACICMSYHVSLELMPSDSSAGQPVVGTVHLLGWSKEVTDFSTLAHRSYDKALFVASMISAFVPIVQLIIIATVDRFKGGGTNIQPLFADYR